MMIGFPYRSAGCNPYLYTEELALERCTVNSSTATATLSGASTPLNIDTWEEALQGHQDGHLNIVTWEEALQGHPKRQFVGYILRYGFKIGRERNHLPCSAHCNLPSAA